MGGGRGYLGLGRIVRGGGYRSLKSGRSFSRSFSEWFRQNIVVKPYSHLPPSPYILDPKPAVGAHILTNTLVLTS